MPHKGEEEMAGSGTRVSDLKGTFSSPVLKRVRIDDEKSRFNGETGETIGFVETLGYSTYVVKLDRGDVQLFVAQQMVLE